MQTKLHAAFAILVVITNELQQFVYGQDFDDRLVHDQLEFGSQPWIEEHVSRHTPFPRHLRADNGLDLRVTKGLGTKRYSKVRVSVIADEERSFPDFNFTYGRQFQYRWTDKYLYSALVDVVPGSTHHLSIGGNDINIYLPAEGEGVKGIIISDPCFSSKYVSCRWGREWNTFNKTVGILNSGLQDLSMSFWQVLGDNWYDQTGEISSLLFSQLSLDVKSKFFATTMGNHDMWICGLPLCGTRGDQWGIGMMQFYPMDSYSSRQSPDDSFLDFTVDPDDTTQGFHWSKPLNAPANLFWFHLLGNVAFIGWSGAFHKDEYTDEFEQACDWAAGSGAEWLMLVSHWDTKGMGCQTGMDSPAVYARLKATPGCQEFGTRLKYQDGHAHCNYVQERAPSGEPVGFIIGGHGMSELSCKGQYGFEYIDSTNGTLQIYYFEVDREDGPHQYDALMDCLQARGSLTSCTHLATVWFDSSDPVPTALEEEGEVHHALSGLWSDGAGSARGIWAA